MPNIMGFGDKLKHLRKNKGMLQKDVAHALDISLRSYSRYECHNIMPQDPDLIARMAEFFQVDKSYLMVVAPSNFESETGDSIFKRSFDIANEEEQAQLLARDALMQLEALYASGKLGNKVEDEIAMTFNQIYFRTKMKKHNHDNISQIQIDDDDDYDDEDYDDYDNDD